MVENYAAIWGLVLDTCRPTGESGATSPHGVEAPPQG